MVTPDTSSSQRYGLTAGSLAILGPNSVLLHVAVSQKNIEISKVSDGIATVLAFKSFLIWWTSTHWLCRRTQLPFGHSTSSQRAASRTYCTCK